MQKHWSKITIGEASEIKEFKGMTGPDPLEDRRISPPYDISHLFPGYTASRPLSGSPDR